MKKKLLLISAFALVFIFSGCSKKEKLKEYNIDTFLEKYSKVERGIKKETKYWNDDEKKGKKYSDVVERYAEKNGFSLNEKVVIRGKVKSIMDFFVSIGTDQEKSTESIMCSFDHNYTQINLLNIGDNTAISGTLFKSKKNDKGDFITTTGLEDCKIKSPNLSKIKFEDNVSEIISSGETEQQRLMGTVLKVVDNPGSEQEKKDALENYSSSTVDGEYKFSSSFGYASHLIILDAGENRGMTCFVRPGSTKALPNTGDKICLQGTYFYYDKIYGFDSTLSLIHVFKDDENA